MVQNAHGVICHLCHSHPILGRSFSRRLLLMRHVLRKTAHQIRHNDPKVANTQARAPLTGQQVGSGIEHLQVQKAPLLLGRESTHAWAASVSAGSDSARIVQAPQVDQRRKLHKALLAHGEVLRFDIGRAPGNGAMLATAGDLVFHGDMSRRFRAFDAGTGERLWETILGGNVSVSTISYAADGRQYIAVMTGSNLKVPELLGVVPEMPAPPEHNAIYVFALP